ncbi:hypothetical protein F2P56_007149, partial [Juglans regia]
MTEEEYCSYRDQVLKTEGFDVDRIPGVSCFHQIQPYNVDKKTWDYEGYSRLAIEEYNFRFKDANAGLEFVKVLKAMGQAANAMRFYLTLEARDLADGGKTKIYQAVVLSGVTKDTVSSFRLKPAEDEKGLLPSDNFFHDPQTIDIFQSLSPTSLQSDLQKLWVVKVAVIEKNGFGKIIFAM